MTCQRIDGSLSRSQLAIAEGMCASTDGDVMDPAVGMELISPSLPDVDAGGGLDVEALPRLDVERVVPRVEVANGVHPVHLRSVVRRELRAHAGFVHLRAPGLREGDEEFPVGAAHVFAVAGHGAEGLAVRLERGGQAGE